MPYRNPFGLEYDSGTYHKVMERVLALGDWAGFVARRAEAKRRGKCRGIGVANYVDTATGVPRERAEITVQPQGVVELVIGTVSSGQGHEQVSPSSSVNGSAFRSTASCWCRAIRRASRWAAGRIPDAR